MQQSFKVGYFNYKGKYRFILNGLLNQGVMPTATGMLRIKVLNSEYEFGHVGRRKHASFILNNPFQITDILKETDIYTGRDTYTTNGYMLNTVDIIHFKFSTSNERHYEKYMRLYTIKADPIKCAEMDKIIGNNLIKKQQINTIIECLKETKNR